jgi:hypothetical protein
MICSAFKSLRGIPHIMRNFSKKGTLGGQNYFNFCMQNDHKVGFIIDIDGTLVLGKKPLPGARDTLELLRKSNIPFLLLTNNVAKSE